MNASPYNAGGFSYASMTMGEKVRAALDLTKQHGASLFLILLVGWLVLGVVFFVGFSIFGGFSLFTGLATGSSSAALSVGVIIGIFIVSIVTIFISYFFMIGVYSLLLKYVDGQEPAGGVIAQVMSPWRNFVPVFLCLLVWFCISLVYNIVIAILSLIPILGVLINLAGTIVMALVMICVYFYIAEKEGSSIGDAVSVPINLVKNNFLTWLLAFVVIVAAYLPGILIAFLLMAVAGKSTFIVVLAMLFFFVYLVAVSIFAFIFWGITYRQTYGGNMGAVVDQVF